MKKIDYSVKNLDVFNTAFLTSVPLLGIVFLVLHIVYEGFNPWLIIPAILMYLLTGISITAGYHRLFAHRAYKTNAFMEMVFLIFGAAAGQNSVLKWATDHRVHHTNVDTDHDPYNIGQGFFYAHIGWVLLKEEKDLHYPKDLLNNKRVMWQNKHILALTIGVNLAISLLVGYFTNNWLGAIAIVGFLRVTFVHHSTFFINSLCHMMGNRPYDDKQTARDSFILALFTFGEGYHNYHHTFQTDYRNGIKWYHFDPTKWLIKTLSYVKFTRDLKMTSEATIIRSRLAVQKNRIETNASEAIKEMLQELSLKVETAQKNLATLKAEYRALKAKKTDEFNTQLEELKLKIKAAKIEFNENYENWLMTLKHCEMVAVRA